MKSKWNVLSNLGEIHLFASPDLVPLPIKETKQNKTYLKIPHIQEVWKAPSENRHFPTLISFWKTKATLLASCTDEKQAQTEHSRNSPWNPIFQIWDQNGSWGEGVVDDERWGESFFFFFVKRNRLHSWILHHVINKTKHTAFLPKHMALFLKHRSGLPWNLVFVSVLFFLFTWDLL